MPKPDLAASAAILMVLALASYACVRRYVYTPRADAVATSLPQHGIGNKASQGSHASMECKSKRSTSEYVIAAIFNGRRMLQRSEGESGTHSTVVSAAELARSLAVYRHSTELAGSNRGNTTDGNRSAPATTSGNATHTADSAATLGSASLHGSRAPAAAPAAGRSSTTMPRPGSGSQQEDYSSYPSLSARLAAMRSSRSQQLSSVEVHEGSSQGGLFSSKVSSTRLGKVRNAFVPARLTRLDC